MFTPSLTSTPSNLRSSGQIIFTAPQTYDPKELQDIHPEIERLVAANPAMMIQMISADQTHTNNFAFDVKNHRVNNQWGIGNGPKVRILDVSLPDDPELEKEYTQQLARTIQSLRPKWNINVIA